MYKKRKVTSRHFFIWLVIFRANPTRSCLPTILPHICPSTHLLQLINVSIPATHRGRTGIADKRTNVRRMNRLRPGALIHGVGGRCCITVGYNMTNRFGRRLVIWYPGGGGTKLLVIWHRGYHRGYQITATPRRFALSGFFQLAGGAIFVQAQEESSYCLTKPVRGELACTKRARLYEKSSYACTKRAPPT